MRFNENEINFKNKKTQKLVEVIDNDSNEISFLSELAIDSLIPKNVDVAVQNPNWLEAMKNEYNTSVEKNVWHYSESR